MGNTLKLGRPASMMEVYKYLKVNRGRGRPKVAGEADDGGEFVPHRGRGRPSRAAAAAEEGHPGMLRGHGQPRGGGPGQGHVERREPPPRGRQPSEKELREGSQVRSKRMWLEQGSDLIVVHIELWRTLGNW